MFAVVEKAGEKKAVHSASDLKYMQDRGWARVEDKPAEPNKTLHLPKKRKAK